MSFPRTSVQQSNEDRDIEVEALRFQAADLIADVLADQGVSRAELARRLGVSAPHITQVLSGERNLTLKTLTEALYALDRRVEMRAAPLREEPTGRHGKEDRSGPHGLPRSSVKGWLSVGELMTAESQGKYKWREGSKVRVRAAAHG